MFNLGNFLGGLYRSGAQAIGGLFHPQLQRPAPQPQQPNLAQFLGNVYHGAAQGVGQAEHQVAQTVRRNVVQPTVARIASINGRPIRNFVNGVANTPLQGVDQLLGGHHTIGSVAQSTPVVSQAIKFGQQSGTPRSTVPSFVKGITKAGVEGAGYVAPELKILKAGKGAGIVTRAIKGIVNQSAAPVALSVAGDLAKGNRNAANIAQNAAVTAGLNAAPGVAMKGLRIAKSGFGALGQAGHINFTTPLEKQTAIRDATANIDDLRNQIAIRRNAIDEAKQTISNHPTLSAKQKQAAISRTVAGHTQAIHDAQVEMGGWIDHIKQIDPKADIPTTRPTPMLDSVPAAQRTLLDHQIAADNKPTLGQKIGQGIRTALGQKNAPLKSTPILKFNLKDRPGSAGERGGINVLQPLDSGDSPKAAANSGVLVGRPHSEFDSKTAPPSQPKIVDNKFTKSVQHSPEVSPEVQAAVSGQHAVRNTKELMQASREQIRTEGLAKSTEQALHSMAVESGKPSDAELARALEVAKAHDALGTQAGHDMATSLYDQISEHGVAKGQGVQILSQIARRSPAGLRNKAFKDLKKAGVEVTPAMKAEIQGHIDAISKMPEGPARDFAVAVLQKSVAKHLPQSAASNVISVWKAGLLSGTKTQGGNLLSNAVFAGLKKASDIPAALVDRAVSLGTGKRTKTFSIRGASGIGEGLKNAKTTMQTGIDMRGVGDKYEQHAELNFKNPIMQKVFGQPSNLIFRGMNAADQPFYYSALKNSLYDQAKADGLSAGKHGAALRSHMDDLVQNPTNKMVETATNDAQKAVLGHDTVASKLISGAKQGIDNMQGVPPATKAVAHAAVDILAPFTKVPSAFLSRSVDFTPLGTGREVFEQIAKGQFDQRKLATAIGEGATGAGIIGMGMALANSGQLSGDYPKNDPKEAARWKTEGIQPNAVKLGGTWVSLNYLGPLGMLFGAGKNMADAAKQGSNQLGAAAAGFGSGLLNQSFVQGLSGFTDAIKNPQQFAQTYLNSQFGSLVPAWSNDVANATDSMQRQTNNVTDAIKSRIPGLRQTLAPKIDSFGNDLTQASGNGLNTAINPFKPSNSIDSPMLSELNRLGQTGKDNVVFPTPVKTIGSGSSQIKLTPEQAIARQKMVGQALTPLWNEIMQSANYKTLDDAHKAQTLQAALTDINGAIDRQMTAKIDSSKLTKAATGNVAKILSGHGPTAEDYLAKAGGKPTTPGGKYQANQAKQLDAQLGGTKYKYGLGTKPKKVKLARAPKLPRPLKLAASQRVRVPKLNLGRKSTLKIAKISRPKAGKKLSLTA